MLEASQLQDKKVLLTQGSSWFLKVPLGSLRFFKVHLGFLKSSKAPLDSFGVLDIEG